MATALLESTPRNVIAELTMRLPSMLSLIAFDRCPAPAIAVRLEASFSLAIVFA
jgi:hypothetical protein